MERKINHNQFHPNMKLKRKTKFLGLATALVALCGCSNEMDGIGEGSTRTITAEIMETATESRSCVDSETLGLNFLGLNWEPSDKIGVYGTADNNVPFSNNETSNTRKTTFSGQSQGMIQYAYFPWTEANNGVAVTALKGNLPEKQTVYANHHLDVDYKYGAATNGTFDTEVKFKPLLSIARMEINADGTTLSDESLKSVSFTAVRDGQPVTMSGDFTFNATDGSVDFSNTTGATTSAVWPEGCALTSHVTGFISILPTLKNGDKLTVKLLTDKQKVSFTVTVAVDFAAGKVYTFPLWLSSYEGKTEYGWVSEPVGSETEVREGTFTCAALNVDGLPSIANSGGPGSDGTKKISQAIAATGWDFFAVSEDFEYDTQLKSSLTAYNSGKYRGSVGIGQALGQVADTDGLNFFWKKAGFSAANETMIQFDDAEGDISHGANTCIKKGFRHYEMTVAEGVVIDVYITHMNTYSGSGTSESNAYWKAQMSQLRQLRDYVIAKAKENNRPAIIMGDTNMRYTRHSIKEQFIDVFNNGGLVVKDPWVEFHRPDYPTFPSMSLMINSKYYSDEGKYNTTDDICCYDNNKGEVVDKIFYINVPGAPLQLKATSYKNDDSDIFVTKTSDHNVSGVTYEDANFIQHKNQSLTITKRWGLADHFPAVATFTWTLTSAK